MAALSGKYAAFFRSHGASVSASDKEMTQVPGTLEYYVTDRTMRLWDPDYAVVVKDGGTPITPVQIDYAGGYVTLAAAPTGAVTASFYYKPIEPLGGGYKWSLDIRSDTQDVTVFSQSLGSPAAWREFLSTLRGWNGNVSAHWFYGMATMVHGNITYTAVPPGLNGNAISITHVNPGATHDLDVTVVGNDITVTLKYADGALASKESEVVAAVNADAEASLLVKASYTGDGTAIVQAKAKINLAGGRESGEEIAKIGTNVLCEFYLDNTTGQYKILRGVGALTGISPNVAIESIIEGDLTYQGTQRLRYHTV